MAITLDEITHEQWLGIQVLHAERNDFQKEQMEGGKDHVAQPDRSNFHRIDR
jgi:hypothetical protein